MSEKIVFLAEGKINVLHNKKATILNSSIAENYQQRQREIQKKNEWKKSGAGARFMGVYFDPIEAEMQNEKLYINGFARCGKEKIVYSLNSGNVGGVYVKDISDPKEMETYVLVKNEMRFYDIDVNCSHRIIASVADEHLERHLALMNVNSSDFNILTEGESYDSNPKWSRKDENVVYYDSCGLGRDSNGNFIQYGPKGIYSLNVSNGDLNEVLVGDKFEFYNPYEDRNGDLFYIKRPYASTEKQTMSLKDILLMPFKILKAIFGWLNFFTQRYAGESLKTNGNNPAKTRQKSPEQIFIDGNLLEVEKNLKQNEANGEKNPGYAPASWVLAVKRANGEEKNLKKGVLNYCVLADNTILYSNGKYIVKLHEADDEEIVAKVHLASKLTYFEEVEGEN